MFERFNISRARRFRLPAIGLLLVALLIGWSCARQENANENQAAESTEVVREAERGPVKLEVTCDRTDITLADRVKLTIKATAEDNVAVHLPEFGESLNEFQIRDFTQPPERKETVNDKTVHVWEQDYDLDIFLSGTYTIPAITVTFEDAREADQDPILGEVSTDPIEVTVASLLEGDVDPTQFQDVKPPVALPEPPLPGWVWFAVAGGIVFLVGLIVVLIILIRSMRNRQERMIQVAPHEWAFDQLRRLIDANLVEQGLIKDFYYHLNEIVRIYIEYRFGMRAPERTTEEFLGELRNTNALLPAHKELLERFLLACDEVKYALYEPGAEEIEKAFNTARDFVDQTAQTAPQQPASGETEEAA